MTLTPFLLPHRQTSNQLILYHPPSHALSVQPHHPLPTIASSSRGAGPSTLPIARRPLLLPYRSETPLETVRTEPSPICPYCSQPLPAVGLGEDVDEGREELEDPIRPKGYFRILEQAHEGSRPPSPGSGRERNRTPTPSLYAEDEVIEEALPAKGYYDRFFREEGRLGIGAEGSVYLATHVIGGNVLGVSLCRPVMWLFRLRVGASLRIPRPISLASC